MIAGARSPARGRKAVKQFNERQRREQRERAREMRERARSGKSCYPVRDNDGPPPRID